ncbi:UDP-glucose dehydrogenase family protein [Variovorax ginsengisoli]|uniref:UDP-glucose 6-dehydrogenase n=1 Tax=Variovorax ginsengisoli TaxID=363844 RepID=A0ABT9SCK3_9BURK|nr:UDP-glucose/GDP-mannose dehydrogenase family protein [Variovorax ginsengisoli]MDP9902079.1 UDPglucose 6-dehydrogenase [Variovorax ginsengisoli]
MNVTLIGTGYVGLVTGACFAEMGNTVTCVDNDPAKIEQLRQGVIPIYEPGLADLVTRNVQQERLQFTTLLGDAMQSADILFLAVGTPARPDGSADMQFVLAVAHEIGRHLQRYTVVVDKSTVPVGTTEQVRAAIQEELDARQVDVPFDVVSNPEFLKEGVAVNDFMSPDRIVIGSTSARAKEVMAALYAPFVRNHPRILYMSERDAEMTKYAANAMLATKISFMNEIANLCELVDVDVEQVRLGIGSDARIGFHFIYAGAGYGGSCFPKDVRALMHIGAAHDYEAGLLRSVDARNNAQKKILFEKIHRHFQGELQSRTIAVWGLAFKPGTDDLREAPSRDLIEALLAAGACVKAFDPEAGAAARRAFAQDVQDSGRLQIVEAQYEAAIDADALVLVTEWKPFRHPDFKTLHRLMRHHAIFDGRNQYMPSAVRDAGFTYAGIGRTAS